MGMMEKKAIRNLQDNIDLPFGADVTEETAKIAIKALEKQVAIKPIVKHLGDDIEVKCPTCKDYHIFMNAKKGNKYCSTCGQKLDWSDERCKLN